MRLIHIPADPDFPESEHPEFAEHYINSSAISCIAKAYNLGGYQFWRVGLPVKGTYSDLTPRQMEALLSQFSAEKAVIPPAPENAKIETGAEILFPMG